MKLRPFDLPRPKFLANLDELVYQRQQQNNEDFTIAAYKLKYPEVAKCGDDVFKNFLNFKNTLISAPCKSGVVLKVTPGNKNKSKDQAIKTNTTRGTVNHNLSLAGLSFLTRSTNVENVEAIRLNGIPAKRQNYQPSYDELVEFVKTEFGVDDPTNMVYTYYRVDGQQQVDLVSVKTMHNS